MNKRGTLTQTTIISLIIVILAGAVLFIVMNNIKISPDKDACHNSIVLRSASIMGIQPTQSLVPLKCKTENIEIKTRDQVTIERTVANAMYDCWWMVSDSEGNPLDFFSESAWREIGLFGTSKANCLICSTIKFDEKLKENPQSIYLMDYLADTKVPIKNITYMEYFTGGQGGLEEKVNAEPSKTDKDLAVVFMMIKGDDLGSALKREGAMVGALVFGGAGLTKSVVGPLGAMGAMGVEGAGALSTVGTASIWIGVAALAAITAGQITTFWTSTHAAAVHCDGNRKGCAGVFLLSLDESEITKTCQNIESIP